MVMKLSLERIITHSSSLSPRCNGRFQFKLERWTNIGVSVVAAFASQDEKEANVLHSAITAILKSCPHGGLKNIDHMLK